MQSPLNLVLEKIQLSKDYVETFSTPHGQRVLTDILARAGVTRAQFHADPAVTQFREGHRHLALSIFRKSKFSPDLLPELITEQLKRQEETQKET
jgi:hypothetical protein